MVEMKERDIDVLEFPDNVRTNPGMYIGDRTNPSHIFREIIDNSVDEALDKNSTCDTIKCYVGEVDNKDESRWFIVADNGRGIPIKESPKKNDYTMAKLAVTTLSAGSNFVGSDSKNGRTSIGMNGVGSSVTCALSLDYYLFISMKMQKHNLNQSPKYIQELFNESKDKDFYFLHFYKGVLQNEGFCSLELVTNSLKGMKIDTDFNTLVAFRPDTESIFTQANANPTKDLRYLQPVLLKMKNKKLNFFLNGQIYESDWKPYKYEFLCHIDSSYHKERENIIKFNEENPTNPKKVPLKGRNKEADVYVSFEVDEKEVSPMVMTGSVNGLIVNKRLHTQIVQNCFRDAMRRVYNFDFRNRELSGMRFDVIVCLDCPEFDSQTKECLVRMDGINGSDFTNPLVSQFIKFINHNRQIFDAHAERIKRLLATEQNLGLVDFCKRSVPSVSDNERAFRVELGKTKLKDAMSRDRKECELFIAEGDSAGGPILAARDVNKHAVLPLRGKVKNVSKKGIQEVLKNEELKAIFLSVGAGTPLTSEIENIRYGKIIIASDADADGLNIESLVAGFMVSQMIHVVEAGYVYFLVSPLYEQNGVPYYSLDDQGFDKTKPYKRFKGLGSLNSDQVRKYILDPKYRHLRRLTVSDIKKALDIIGTTDGKKEVMYASYSVDYGDSLTYSEVDRYAQEEIVE